jgi:hypothetical protein
VLKIEPKTAFIQKTCFRDFFDSGDIELSAIDSLAVARSGTDEQMLRELPGNSARGCNPRVNVLILKYF